MSFHDNDDGPPFSKVVRLNDNALLTSVNASASKTAVILASDLASDKGVVLQGENERSSSSPTNADQDGASLSAPLHLTVPSNQIFDASKHNGCICDLFLIFCAESDYSNVSKSPASFKSDDRTDGASSPSSRNNLSVFTFRTLQQNDDGDDEQQMQGDVVKLISEVSPKALLVMDNTAENSQQQLRATTAVCLECNLLFVNSQTQKDPFGDHMLSAHSGVLTEAVERRRETFRTQPEPSLPFVAFVPSKTSSLAQQSQFIDALPWQHLSVVMPASSAASTPKPPSLPSPTKQMEVDEDNSGTNINNINVSNNILLPSSFEKTLVKPATPGKLPPTSALMSQGATSLVNTRMYAMPTASTGATRCVSKTLKCPRCNWHYKYQETLEIHMREKHPDADSSQCVYCATKRDHPRLSRGENYSCGYKPYRCEICNYATTTKGNLSIHMQSDKHLHNVQEFAASQGADARPVSSTAAIEASTLAAAAASLRHQQQQRMQQTTAPPKPGTDSSDSAKSAIASASNKHAVPTTTATTSTKPSSDSFRRSGTGNSQFAAAKSKASAEGAQSSSSSSLNRASLSLGDRSSNFSASSLQSPSSQSTAALTAAALASLTSSSQPSSISALLSPSSSSTAVPPPLALPTSSSLGLNDVSVESVMQQYALCRDLIMNPEFQQQTGCDASTANLLLQQLAAAALTAPSASSTTSSLLESLMQQPSTTPASSNNKKSKDSLPPSNLLASSSKTSKMFECLLCENFATDSLLDLKAHMDFDRTLNPPIHDFDSRVLAMLDNFYYCKLCSYKTPLKANFQVHSKTEKHLQKFQMLLHILEGNAAKAEAKLANFANVVCSVRCVACDFPAASAHRLDQHALSIRHELFCKLQADIAAFGRDAKYNFVCRLCSSDNTFTSKAQLSRHLASSEHVRQETILQAQRAGSSCMDVSNGSALPEVDLRQFIEVELNSVNASPAASSFVSSTHDLDSSSIMPSRLGSTLTATPPSLVPTTKTASLSCPICQMHFNSATARVQHLTDVHSVPQSSVPRLLELMALVDGASGSSSAVAAAAAAAAAATFPSPLQPLDTATTSAVNLTTADNKNLKRPLSSTPKNQTENAKQPSTDSKTSPMDLSVPKKPKMANAISPAPKLPKDEPKLSNPFNMSPDALSALTGQLTYDQMVQSLLSSTLSQSLFPPMPSLSSASALGQLSAIATSTAAAAATSNSSLSVGTDAEQYRCHSCSRLFATVDSLFSHLAESQHLNNNSSTASGPGLLCWKKGCNQYFKTTYTLKMHFKQIHNVPLPDFILESISTANKSKASSSGAGSSHGQQNKAHNFKCTHCSLSFDTAAALESHGKLHLANMSGFNCAVCGAWQETFYDYTEHLNTHRLNLGSKAATPKLVDDASSSSKSATASGSFRCESCNLSFPDIDLFRGHCHSVAHKINSAENGLNNNQSGSSGVASKKASSSKPAGANGQLDTASTGVYGATPSGSYTCDICEISFARQTYLQQHLLSPYHQRSVKRLQDSLMEQGRRNIMDTLQQAYSSTFQPPPSVQAPVVPTDTKSLLSSLDIATATAAIASNPLLTNQLLASLAATSFPSTPASALWSATTGLPAAFGSSLSTLTSTPPPALQGQQPMQFPSARSEKKSPLKSSSAGNTASTSLAHGAGPAMSSTPVSATDRKSKCNARIWKMLENVGSDVVMSRLCGLLSLQPPGETMSASSSSTSTASCSTCTSLADLEDPMPLMEHRESSHGLSITAKDVEDVIRVKPELFGSRVGEEFRSAVQGSEKDSSSSATPNTEKEKPAPENSKQHDSQQPRAKTPVSTCEAPSSSADILNQLDPLLSICAAAGLLDPSSAASTSSLLASQPLQALASLSSTQQQQVKQPTSQLGASPAVPDSSKPASASSSSAAAASIESGRTRITDEQRAVFREYFNIDNLPSDVEVNQICERTGLGRKVVRHWFRNNLFKERQRCQNSPYNLNIPPPASPGSDAVKEEVDAAIDKDFAPCDEADDPSDAVDVKMEALAPPLKQGQQVQQDGAGDESSNMDYDLEDYEDDGDLSKSYAADAMSRSGDESAIGDATATSNCYRNGNSGSWRRASRTKFSDYQLQSLTEAFERNPYPREEDQKRLSQQLGLGQRVVIVWFQNMRQKTRRSSQGSMVSVASGGSSGRGSNNDTSDQQSASITHLLQQPVTADGEGEPNFGVSMSSGDHDDQDSNDSRGLVIFESEPHQEGAGGESQANVSTNNFNNKRNRTTITPAQYDILYDSFLRSTNPSREEIEALCVQTGLERRTVQVWFQNTRSRERKNTNLTAANAVCESLAKFQQQFSGDERTSSSSLPQFATDGNDVRKNGQSNSSWTNNLVENSVSSSMVSDEDDGYNDSELHNALGSANNLTASGNSLSTGPAVTINKSHRRFRTQLTQLQIRIMRSIFEHHKNPAQGECIQLGNEIGLQKQVVQVWFQNARAKEKKAKLGFAMGSMSLPQSAGHQPLAASDLCPDCQEVVGSSQVEHLLSKVHLNALKTKLGRLIGGGNDTAGAGNSSNNNSLSSDDSNGAINTNAQSICLSPSTLAHHHSLNSAIQHLLPQRKPPSSSSALLTSNAQ